MRAVYYNDNDPFVCAWLRNLIGAGELPDGEVDGRSIVDVKPDDLRPFRQCHFFAGVGGWPYALRLAGWPDDRPVWTGSPPCQPLSVAAVHRRGHADPRHLWPAFHRLIAERCPPIVFGEQVASKDGFEWFCGIRADLEAGEYAVGGADLPAASVAAPHQRNRIFWVAQSGSTGGGSERGALGDEGRDAMGSWPTGLRSGKRPFVSDRPHSADNDGDHWRDWTQVGWSDGALRRSKSGLALLVDGFPGHLEQWRAYGNAIVPQVAAEFIRAAM
jgi:DNA (cytosine-5)-methyltransferase 1